MNDVSIDRFSISQLIDQFNTLPLPKRKAVIAGILDSPLAWKQDKNLEVIIWHNKLVKFVTNQYIKKPSDIWILDSILGRYRISRRLKQVNYHLRSETIEMMFMDVSLSFYTSTNKTYLLSVRNELTEADFGPLQRISALDALKQFGLESMEIAKEKGYVRLQQ